MGRFLMFMTKFKISIGEIKILKYENGAKHNKEDIGGLYRGRNSIQMSLLCQHRLYYCLQLLGHDPEMNHRKI